MVDAAAHVDNIISMTLDNLAGVEIFAVAVALLAVDLAFDADELVVAHMPLLYRHIGGWRRLATPQSLRHGRRRRVQLTASTAFACLDCLTHTNSHTVVSFYNTANT